MLQQRVRAQLDTEGHQVVTITIRDGYHPNSIVARAGMPLRLVLRRDEDDACSERVVFSRPKLDRRVSLTGTTTIDLPAQPPGQVRFTCGMGRYHGRIDLVDEEAPPTLRRAREWISGHQRPGGAALLMWLTSLPLIAVAAAFLLDGMAAVVTASAALVAWLAGGAWAVARSAPPN
ncbi:MAG: cupredoxin domain-containing protein [Candidatus Limnocylindrales bacterium]